MKKIITILMTLLCLVSFSACSKKEESTNNEVKEETSTIVDDSMQEDIDKLSDIGEVEVKDGILTVSITLPSSFMEGVSQEDLDKDAGTSYVSAKLNDDGSVTMKLTKAQYEEMLKDFSDQIEDTINEMKEDEDYNITEIKHNDNFTVFDVTLSTSEVGIYESIAVLGLYMYGGMYGIFAGNKADNIVVNFYDSSNNLIESVDSSSLSD